METVSARQVVLALVAGAIAVAVATLVVAALETFVGVRDASAAYVVAVAAVAIAIGTGGAVLTAVLAVLAYDFLFTDPLHTLWVADAGELLDLVLLLFVAAIVGQLAGLQRRRAEVAEAREREARALFEVSSALARRQSTPAALETVAGVLAREARLGRAWITLGGDDVGERIVADSAAGSLPRRGTGYFVLQRGDRPEAATWALVRTPLVAGTALTRPGPPRPSRNGAERHYRVRLETAERTIGSLWGMRPSRDGQPDPAATRLLVVAADQVTQALEQDRLEESAKNAEIARQSDALKSALLQSVSHDLRTPLGSIRTYAGTLMDDEVQLSPDEARASAAAIDREAQRLDRLVANLLDLGRIEGGALRAHREALDVEDVVGRAIALVRPRSREREWRVEVQPGCAIDSDPVLVEEVLVNLLENAVRHTPDGTVVEVSTTDVSDDAVRLTVEDGGPGVPREAMPHLFDKFYRVPGERWSRGSGSGIGLAVVRGLVEALGGTVTARSSRLGGLAIDVDLPAARLPGEISMDPG